MNADGTIVIDSFIDTKGFEEGVKNLIGKLKPLAVAFLGIMGISSILGVSKLTAEFQRLGLAAQGVAQMYGQTSEQSRGLIDELVKSGIQTDVATRAYINFAREGMDTELLPALARGAQDLNVFSEAGGSSSQVMNALAIGIQKLDSQILRTAGVTVDMNVAQADYAKTIGKSVGALTLQEKRQAALVAVTEKLKGVSGLYELSQKSLAGQLSSNSRIMNEFKAAFGVPFQDALFQVVKGFNSLIKVLTKAIQPGGMFYGMIINIGAALTIVGRLISSVFGAIASLFGVKVPAATTASTEAVGALASSAESAEAAQEGLAGGIKKAEKAAKGSLAAFDQLNVLQQDTGDADAAGGGGGGGPAIPDIGGVPGLENLQAFDFDKIMDPLDEIRDRADKLQLELADTFKPLLDALLRLKEAVLPLGLTLWSGLVWVWENILVPLGLWAANTLLPAVFDLFGAAVIVFNEALIALQPLGIWLWENFLQPLAEWTGEVIIQALEWLTEKLVILGEWIKANPEKFQTFVTVLLVIVGAFYLATAAVAAWTAIAGIGTVATAAFGAAVAFLSSPVILVMLAILALIAIIVLLIKYWPQIEAAGKKALETVINTWIVAAEWFRTKVIDPIKKGFTTALDSIKNNFQSIFTGIKNFIKGIINSIIDMINGMISGIVSGINGIITAANVIASVIPGRPRIAYVSAPQIPRLATGAVIPPNAEFAAILGDQKSGRNIEAPEKLIRQIVREEMGTLKTDVKVTFEGSMAQFVRSLKPHIDVESVRVGKNLVTNGAA